VIGKDSTRWFQTILINKGSKEGLVKNIAVLTPEGIVGHIIEVSAGVSKVLLINDINSSVSAIVQRNRTQGIVVGSGGELCRTKFLSNTADIRDGDIMVTSGLGGIYPKGITIGRLHNIVRKPTGLFLEAEVKPGADLIRLEEVLIVVDRLPARRK
jgi:rod shape-determining protein MreC